ncbi:SMC family ATPase [Rothia sp. (in: high G+C Gram-positive bacteria)]|uniref:AAA family ATPase n=1 Tax=Rothia sp. (in: high G+C Gram-positive bacteria) TaxID=1885016 RepID=UPI001CB1A533|nr:SMC family ATPase [Rothia sp. (in: high G+C Gram-positive bacteria)]MBF1668697.1 SMC family ATPase [Rothia sp. (in: high G+C Gram-positive bacteria)]MBF1678451.1 SMC family ATPase [Rothia sp. (in: high G+C Gram-positive bacteria)]
MILHNLEFEAFMAYPKRQEINFDTLNNAGVFLLNGPTGAGKTTILDAICYALYGETSSDRESAKLHSTYAAHSGTKPRVLLDVTLHGKRLRIDRTPAYNKPITRGARKGQMREESAKATLAELAPGADPSDEKAWTPISSSVAEVNRTIAERTHLTKEQFLKVVLLPQGQFAQFLKSKPKERKELLKKMFPVEHYEQLFAALTEEAKTAQQEVAQDENTQRGYLERARAEMLALQALLDAADPDAEEAAGEETSEQLTAESVTAETLDTWIAVGIARARETSTREKQEQQRLTDEADRNTRLLAERAQLQADWREYEQLCERRTRLTERADEHKAQREELAQARAAAPLHAQYAQVQAESQALAAREQEHSACASALEENGRALLAALRDEETSADVTFPEETTFAALPDLEPAEQETQLEALLDTLRALQKKDAQLTDEEAAVAALLKQANALEQDKARAEKTLSDLTAAAEQLAEELAGYSTADEERTLAAHLVTEAQQKHDAAQQMQQKLDAASAAVAEAEKQNKRTATAEQKAQEKWQASAQQALAATEEFKNLQVLRLAQASSLLARELKDGEPCAVCGSVEHPAPAQIAEGEQLVERADLDAAKEREDKAHKQARTHELAKDRATKAHQEASEALAAARTQYETLAAQGECDVEQTAAQLQQAQTRLAQAQSRVTARDGVLAKVERVRVELQKAQEALRTIEGAAVEAQTRHRDAAARCEATAADLAPARAAVGFAQRVEAVEGYRAAHQRLARAVLLLGQARERHALAAAQAQRLLGESAFESAELVQTAVRTPERVDALEQAVAAYELEHARLLEGFGREAIVAVAARVAAGEQAPDDLQGVREQVEQLRAAVHRLTLREGERESLLRSLQALRGEYAAFRAKTAQRYDRAQMLANLAAAARGDTLGGYEHQVDLVSYVLGAEFERILHSASLHLDRMSEGRYGMVFSDHRAKGSRSGGGLNLEITDTWTGEPREASSLSGGESFLASLSLALGLAEVVQANNGGIELDTLFIDEGFGTLDAETLDMVMGTIESLRDSGRTIGLISHVEEMKNRIPAQIVVEKGQNGSSVRVNS